MADGPICGCGGNGCLETLASDIAFIRRIWPDRSADPAVYSESERVALVAEGIQMAQNRESSAYEAFQSTADYLGIGIGNAIMIMDPDAVVLSGTMIDCAPIFVMDIFRKTILQSVWRESQGVQIMPHIGSQNSVLKGALGLVICQPYFELQRENTTSRSIARFCLPDL
jgi:glucokinase